MDSFVEDRGSVVGNTGNYYIAVDSVLFDQLDDEFSCLFLDKCAACDYFRNGHRVQILHWLLRGKEPFTKLQTQN